MAQQGDGNNQQQHTMSIEAVVGEITTATSQAALAERLRHFSNNREHARESVLASALPNGQDSLELLNVTKDTVGIFFILCVVFLPDCMQGSYLQSTGARVLRCLRRAQEMFHNQTFTLLKLSSICSILPKLVWYQTEVWQT